MNDKEVAMAILVHFKNNDFEYIEDGELDTLIEQDAIYSFKLASGWVQVGKESAAHPCPVTADV